MRHRTKKTGRSAERSRSARRLGSTVWDDAAWIGIVLGGAGLLFLAAIGVVTVCALILEALGVQ